MLNNTNGWSGSAVVTNLAYIYDGANKGFPVVGTHTKVLDVAGGATNAIDGASSSVVWVDSIINAEAFWSEPGHPEVDTNANACVYVNANGNLVAGHTEYGSSNLIWSVFDAVAISSNDWNRVALQLDYRTHYYSILLNGVMLEHAVGRTTPNGSGAGGVWFPMIGTFPFVGIALEGDAFVDDLVVSEDAPYVSITVADAGAVAEGDRGTTFASFTISLSSTSSVPVRFDYATSDGTAVAGTDYIAKSGILVIPAGVLQAVVDVEIFGDTEEESDLDFFLEVSNLVNALIVDAHGSATIVDDDVVISADLVVTGTTSKITDGALSNPSGGVTNHFSASETVDWVVWNGASITPAERKNGGMAFTGFSSIQSWSIGTGNRIFTAWEDGTVVPAATNFSGLAMTDVGQDVPYTAVDFSIGLQPVTAGSYYRLKIYSTDKRNNSSVKYWDVDSRSHVVATSETDNDAADLRIHEIIISNVTANATLPLQLAGERTGSGFPVVLGGMELILVGSLLPPPEEGGYAGWTGDFLLSGTNALLIADPDGSGYNNLYEYAFGGNPTNADDNGADPTYGLNGDQIEYVYLRRNDTNLNYAVVVGTNLFSGSWSSNDVLEVGSATKDGNYDSVTNYIPTVGKTNGFIRVQVDVL
ncbi:Calx-beta domain-containing protein [Pontiella desulfatans]|nr:Calx-beta domain-containing protein [Pontiella desulfatans]